MGNRRITSSFQMVSYKIDKLELSVKDENASLLQKNLFPTEQWAFGVALRAPQYAAKERAYFSGLEVRLIFGDRDHPEIELDAGICGLFRVIGDDFSPEVENKIAKIQFPAILFPYLRAAITNILASAGFGSVVLPLININALAEDQLKDVEIIRLGEDNDANDDTE